MYSLNALLVVQETADVFGFVCLIILFLSAQLFARNSMFSVFLLNSNNPLSPAPVKARPTFNVKGVHTDPRKYLAAKALNDRLSRWPTNM